LQPAVDLFNNSSVMRYREYLPSPQCARVVEKYWVLEGHATGAPGTIIPDGRIELVFHYGGEFWRHSARAPAVKQPGSLLVGQMIEPVVLVPDGYAGVAAIRLRPAAARTFLGFSPSEVLGSFMDLELVFPSTARLRERLADASDDKLVRSASRLRDPRHLDLERVAALERWLIEMACPLPRAPVEAAVGAILQTGGRATIRSLVARTPMGVRQLERHFLDDVGLSPKTFARIVRLQVALRRIREGSTLTHVALACGYYDQAHMTRDFRHLAAMSPGAWQTHAGELAALFVDGTVTPR
jgi:AraC-like DNA-binding protein